MSSSVDTGIATRRPPRRTGFMAEIAEGIAAAVLSAPEFAAVVLLASTLWIVNTSLYIGIAHLGGVALARTRSDRRLVVASVWIGLAALKWFVEIDSRLRSVGFGDIRAI